METAWSFGRGVCHYRPEGLDLCLNTRKVRLVQERPPPLPLHTGVVQFRCELVYVHVTGDREPEK